VTMTDERGVTMVELIVGMGIGVVVAALAVFVLRAALQTQAAVTGSTRAATDGQAIANLIDTSVRTASGLSVPDPARLDVRLPDACRSFVVSGGDLYYKRSAGPTGTTLDATWTRLSSWAPDAGAASGAGLRVEQVRDPSTGMLAPYFASLRSGTGAAYSLRLVGMERKVDIASSIMQRATGGSGPTCF
jgi:hypothetical protein